MLECLAFCFVFAVMTSTALLRTRLTTLLLTETGAATAAAAAYGPFS